MRKWIYTTLGHHGTVTTTVDGDTIEMESGTEVYVASEVDAVLKRQASAAIAGMNAATAVMRLEREARITELEDALREIAGYPQPDEQLDSVAQDMRRCARGVLRPSY